MKRRHHRGLDRGPALGLRRGHEPGIGQHRVGPRNVPPGIHHAAEVTRPGRAYGLGTQGGPAEAGFRDPVVAADTGLNLVLAAGK
ncbi:hypothetical protein Abr02nite_45480 [Paractinoplanes brasiliensis]|nr:hypothetical protein Abr02nite_45480 [Actinoplanes brasiliensis]